MSQNTNPNAVPAFRDWKYLCSDNKDMKNWLKVRKSIKFHRIGYRKFPVEVRV